MVEERAVGEGPSSTWDEVGARAEGGGVGGKV